MCSCPHPISLFSRKLSSQQREERDRYFPILNTLNVILRNRGDKTYQNIPSPQLHESEVLYIPSDSVTIESNYLRHGKNARVDCKLDAVSVLCLLDVLKEDDTPQFALDDMSATIDRRYFSKNERKMSCNST